jgi:sulfotransferase family protein
MDTLIEPQPITNAPEPASAQASRETSELVADPLFLLAPPRSFTSVVGTMLGQHPQMYGLPETHLFGCATMTEWWGVCEEQTFPRAHGLLRAVAELFFGGQTEATVRQASGWLRRRSHFTTGMLMETLAARVHPRIIVDKSPSVVYSVKFLERIRDLFPRARYIHLLRHPRAHGESVMKFIEERKRHGPIPESHWLLHLCTYPDLSPAASDVLERSREIDPQKGWYVLNHNIDEFFKSLPDGQKLRVRGEDLLQSPDEPLHRIAEWMGVRADAEAIDEMKHPERSPYACFGPPGARYGNDTFFLESPALRPARAKPQSLDGPLSWREDGSDFLPEVKQLARELGYE